MISKKNIIKKILVICGFIFFINTQAVSAELRTFSSTLKQKFGPISVLTLKGTREQMGFQYGQALQAELRQELNIIKQFYTIQHGVSYEKLKEHGDLLYQRFPLSYQKFIQGITKGSGLNLDDAKILNAMETLGELLPLPGNEVRCAFLLLPKNKTLTHSTLIGRNYDYPAPFDQLSKYLVVTVLLEDNAIPTAFISLGGEIYCPTCLNKNGLFMELNNGTPSGGTYVDTNRQSLLINMLQIMQNSNDLSQMEKQLNATQSDFSLIVNTADKVHIKSYEYSSTLGMKNLLPLENIVFASTNFYLNDTWKDIPIPTDSTTYMGVTRRNNLLNLANQSNQFDVESFKHLMDKPIKEGGGKWELTIYQIIFDTRDLSLYVKINNYQKDWAKIPMNKLFSNTSGVIQK